MSLQRPRHLTFATAVTILTLVAAIGAPPALAAPPSAVAHAPALSPVVTTAPAHPHKEVFGFALASSLADPTVGYPSWNFDLLRTVAFFGLHVNTSGRFASDSGWATWNSSTLTNFVAMAHQHGTKVVLTVVLQDFSANTPSMCAGLAHSDATVTQTLAEVRAKGVDGVNIDYEGLNGSCGTTDGFWARHAMTGLAKKMKAGLGPSYYLSVDTYASSATDGYGFFDVTGLSAYADSFFVMAYDLEYSNYSRPPISCGRMCLGPTSPLSTYYYNDTKVTSEYVAAVGANKVILGVPYYGRKACVGSAVANAYPTSTVVADGYLDATGEATFATVKPGSYVTHREAHSAGMERWDTWFNTQLNCTRELYWDDAVSLGKKYDLVNADNLRGVGIWNLNYGGGAPELWAALANHFIVCTAVAVAANPASPQVGGTAVQFTATASGCNSPEYEFWVQAPGSAIWSVGQAYSGSPVFAWGTAGKPTGTYRLSVWARTAGSAGLNHSGLGGYDTYAAALYSLLSKPCLGVTAGVTPASPMASGSGGTVLITGAVSGCPNPLYEFWMQAAGSSTWRLVQGYSANSSYRWNTTGAPAGTDHFGVWTRDAGSSAGYDSFVSVPYTLTARCASPKVTFSPPSPIARGSGTPVTVTAASAGCPNPLYEFWMRAASSSTWQMVQAYSTSATYLWNTSGAPAGTVYFGVWTRDATSGKSYDATDSAPFSLISPCTSATATFSPPSGVAHGTGAIVTITASSAGCPNPVYQLWMKPSGSSTWQLLRGYSSTTTYSWNTKGAPAGTETFGVWARDGSSPAAYDALYSAQYLLS